MKNYRIIVNALKQHYVQKRSYLVWKTVLGPFTSEREARNMAANHALSNDFKVVE